MKVRIAANLVILGIFLLQLVFAQTQLNIYLNREGNARFYGKIDGNFNASLPQGIYLNGDLILGSTDSLTKKEGNIWIVNFSLKESYLNIILPKKARIKKLIYGEAYANDNSLSIYNYEKITLYYTLEEKEDSKKLIYIALGIFFIVFAFILLYKKYHNNKYSKKNDIELIKKTLNKRENLIIDKLLEVKKIKQSQLSKITDIPKASLSRHLLQLEKKGIIKRVGEGKNKVILLKNVL